MAIGTWTDGNQLGASDVNSKIVQATLVSKPVDESVTSSTSMQNDNHLSFIDATRNTNYFVKAHIIVSGVIWSVLGVSKGAITYGWYGPSGATFTWCSDALGGGGDSDDDGWGMVSRTRQTIGLTPGMQTLGTTTSDYLTISARGILKVGATSGTFGFRWAQTVSDGTPTTVRALSALYVTRML